ncbi:MAG TPA: hypothetical protein VF972_09165, partial [Actinomycetota bacterium]
FAGHERGRLRCPFDVVADGQLRHAVLPLLDLVRDAGEPLRLELQEVQARGVDQLPGRIGR